jgi:uncharacterized protein (DUF362 family)
MNAKHLLLLVTVAGTLAASNQPAPEAPRAAEPEPLKPLGKAKGIHPGRVVWVHDPLVLDWKGPRDGHWYEGSHTKQDRADGMMDQAVRQLTGEPTVAKSWDKLFRHFNQARGKGDAGYKPGEKLFIKPNWVGLIWREGNINPQTSTLTNRQDYMNTSPQLIVALLRQLVQRAGLKQADITVGDTLAILPKEYYDILHQAFPDVRYVDYEGKAGRVKTGCSAVPLYWSCRPQEKKTDYLPSCITEAEYLINFANLKAHGGTGVTLCGKNHFGSLVRWPAQEGYYDLHHSFSKDVEIYREQVDLMGHSQLGGKTVLYLIDGLFSGKHPFDQEPRPMNIPPFNGDWPKSLFASQDPVAIDSVGFDFLRAEFDDFPRVRGVDDYLHEAALASNPPSGTFYDPDHAQPVKRLASLGVHEHWNNPKEKKYSRNLGSGKGIELVAVELGDPAAKTGRSTSKP